MLWIRLNPPSHPFHFTPPSRPPLHYDAALLLCCSTPRHFCLFVITCKNDIHFHYEFTVLGFFSFFFLFFFFFWFVGTVRSTSEAQVDCWIIDQVMELHGLLAFEGFQLLSDERCRVETLWDCTGSWASKLVQREMCDEVCHCRRYWSLRVVALQLHLNLTPKSGSWWLKQLINWSVGCAAKLGTFVAISDGESGGRQLCNSGW